LLLSAKLLYRGVSPLRPTPDREEILEVEHILLDFGIILGAGLVSQFLATFLRIPEMIVLVAVGALIGPSALGIVENPLNGVGAQLIFTVGVAMILFHGGVGISLRVISRTAVGLGLLVLPGVAITAFIVAVVVAPIFGVSLLVLLIIASSGGGFVMALYSTMLIVLNRRALPNEIRLKGYRLVVIAITAVFFIALSLFLLYQIITAPGTLA
jgi:NhaP-type Na+/H+ and K+/H+ antiporter